MNKYLPVIGLEVHVELKTKSKMFCACSSEYFGKEPNTHTCPVCLGLPGALPVPNKTAINWCILIGLALNCEINEYSKFDRKNYFYPDLAKGYQISQYDLPFAKNGYLNLKNGKTIHIRRVHMEEDTAKLTHQMEDNRSSVKDKDIKGVSLIDFNRSGVPLVEIVTEPDFENAFEVKEYLQKLQQIIRYLEVSNANMEKGEMRLEPNISLKKIDTKELPEYKVEVKNINSFRFVEKAVNYEIKRQHDLLEKGETPAQETRGWNELKQVTFSQRKKEEAHDYRYFPEPDIPPIIWTKQQLGNLKVRLPELPDKKINRFINKYMLSDYDAEILTRDKSIADIFEKAVSVGKENGLTPKQLANIIINKKDINTKDPALIVEAALGSFKVNKIDDNRLQQIIDDVLKENQKATADYINGKETVIMYLVGQVMRKLGGNADAKLIKQKLEVSLKDF